MTPRIFWIFWSVEREESPMTCRSAALMEAKQYSTTSESRACLSANRT